MLANPVSINIFFKIKPMVSLKIFKGVLKIKKIKRAKRRASIIKPANPQMVVCMGESECVNVSECVGKSWKRPRR